MPGNKPQTRKTSSERPSKPSPTVLAIPETDESTLEIGADAMRIAVLRVREELRGIVAGTLTHEKFGPAERCAHLANELAPVVGQLRQIEKAAQQRLEDFTEGDLLAWWNLQAPDTRARLLRELGEVDAPSRRSVLGSSGGRRPA